MLARQFRPADYGLVVSDLLLPPRLPQLGMGAPDQSRYKTLNGLSHKHLFGNREVVDPDMADACRAALWLYHDFFDESHNISQEIHTPTGSFWHGILHRREPDYSNAKYWFRQVGSHPVYEPLLVAAQQLSCKAPPDPTGGAFTKQQTWNPISFVDLCQQANQGNRSHLISLCRRIQLREWELLFDFCYRNALATTSA